MHTLPTFTFSSTKVHFFDLGWCSCLSFSSCAKSLQSSLTLCDSIGCSPLGSSVRGILQAGILDWVAMPSSGGSPDPGIEPTSLMSSALAGGFFTTSTGWEAHSLVSTKEEVLGNKYTKSSPAFSLHNIYSRFIFSQKRCQDQRFSGSREACRGMLQAFYHRTNE